MQREGLLDLKDPLETLDAKVLRDQLVQRAS
jgi:hypothetical protein